MSRVILISDSSDDEELPKTNAKSASVSQIKEENHAANDDPSLADAEGSKRPNASNAASTPTGVKQNRKDSASNGSQTADVFEEFVEKCSDLVKDKPRGKDIIKFLRTKNARASTEYKYSRSYRKLLQGFLSQIRKGSKDVYIFINDATSILEQHAVKNRKRSNTDKTDTVKSQSGEGIKKRRISLEPCESNKIPDETVIKTDKVTDSTKTETEEPQVPSTSGNTGSDVCDPPEQTEGNPKLHKKVKYLERLLKKLSDEISVLQEAELTIEDMDRPDSSHIQEEQLKKRFMLVYKELCKLRKCSFSTGRILERRIRVRSSRFEEINRKVESFVNNPKRDSITRFPDYPDIFYLVKQASVKNQLNLSESQLKSTAQHIFREVGESMQKRRHNDFVYEFGSWVVDANKDDPDPATCDETLEEKLQMNRKLAKTNLDAVNMKFCNMQYEVGTASTSGKNVSKAGLGDQNEQQKTSRTEDITEAVKKEKPRDSLNELNGLNSAEVITIDEDDN